MTSTKPPVPNYSGGEISRLNGRIAELEVEVAELRRITTGCTRCDWRGPATEAEEWQCPRCSALVDNVDGSNIGHVGKCPCARCNAPRRTPELTERVAAYFEAKGCTRGYAGELALGFLDLVFGKKDE